MLVKFPRATRYPIKEANPCLTPHVFLGRRLTSPVGVSHHALPEVLACPLHDFATSLYRSTYGGCSSFSPVAGQVVHVGASWPGGAALLRVDLAFDPIRKKVKIFLSPVAGQVVDVGAFWSGGAALLRVDIAFDPIGKKSENFSKSRSGPDTQRNLD